VPIALRLFKRSNVSLKMTFQGRNMYLR